MKRVLLFLMFISQYKKMASYFSDLFNSKKKKERKKKEIKKETPPPKKQTNKQKSHLIFDVFRTIILPSRLGLQNTPTASLQRGKTNGCPGYDTKQSHGEVPAVLELQGMRSTPSLPSLPGPVEPGVVAPDKDPIYGLNGTNGILMLN